MNLYFIIRPGDGPGRIKSVITTLLLLVGVGYIIWPEEQVVVETLTVKAVVVPRPDEKIDDNRTSVFRQTKIRLPDGTHAYINFKAVEPNPGETVSVRVNVNRRF